MGHDQLVLLVVFLVVIEMLLAGKSDLGSDRATLLELRKEVSGRTLLWNVSQQSPCGWAEVLCEKNRVVGLRLPGCSLTGEIPVGIIGNLTELHVLSLRNAYYSFSLFDPIPTTLSCPQTPPILTPPYQQYNPSHDTGPAFPFPLSQASLISPLPSSSLPNKFSHISRLQLNPVTFSQNSLPILPNQFKFDQMVPPILDFSMNPELPSSQFPQKTHSCTADNTADNMKTISTSSSNSGLLDALIAQAQAMVWKDSSWRQASFSSQEEKHVHIDDFELFLSGSTTNPPLVSVPPQWDDSTYFQPFNGKLLV